MTKDLVLNPCSEIMDRIRAHKHKRIAIVAGHYCIASNLSDLSNMGETEFFSFKLGVAVYKELKLSNNSPVLILWINDIGINTEERKILKETYRIPQNYAQVLVDNKIPMADVQVLFESTSRNKASVLFRKAYKKNPDRYKIYSSKDKTLVRCIDNNQCTIGIDKKAYALLDPDGVPIVTKEGSNPKCNLILGTLFRSIINNYKSDFVLNIFNDIYINRLRLGIFVGKYVYGLDANFINYFCDEDSVFNDDF